MADDSYLTWEECLALEEQIYQRQQARKAAARQAEKDYWRDDTSDIEPEHPHYTDAAQLATYRQERTK